MLYYYIMYVLGRLRRRFFNQIPENQNEYKNSRNAFIVDGATCSVILVFVGGAYLSGYLKHIGVSDSLNGIISAIPSLASIMQLAGAGIMQVLKKRKLFVCIFALLHRLLFSSMFIFPMFIQDTQARVIAVVAMFGFAYVISAFITPAASNWIVSLIPNSIRGKYFSVRELATTAAYAVASLVMGWVLDYFNDVGRQREGYLFLGGFLLIVTVVNIVALIVSKEPETDMSRENNSILKIIAMPFMDKDFRPVLFALVLWTVSIQIAIPYYGLFLISDLKLSYSFISAMVFFNGIAKAVLVRFWGKFADSRSWATVFRYVCLILGVVYIATATLTQSNAGWLYPIVTMLSAVPWAAANITTFNIQYDYAPVDRRMFYVGASGAFIGVIGFCSVFIGAAVVNYTSHSPVVIAGNNIVAEQILLMISSVILIATSVYIRLMLENKQRVVNTRDGMVD